MENDFGSNVSSSDSELGKIYGPTFTFVGSMPFIVTSNVVISLSISKREICHLIALRFLVLKRFFSYGYVSLEALKAAC